MRLLHDNIVWSHCGVLHYPYYEEWSWVMFTGKIIIKQIYKQSEIKFICKEHEPKSIQTLTIITSEGYISCHGMHRFISSQVSEISERSETSAEIAHLARETVPYAFYRTISDVLCTFKRFHNFIFQQSARWVYLGPGVKVGSLFWSARIRST